MTIYNPNDTSCTAWKGMDSGDPPATRDGGSETEMSSAEKDTISADDANSVDVSNTGYPASSWHKIKLNTAEATATATITAKGYGEDSAGPTYSWVLEGWNANTSAWETLDSHTTGSKDTLTYNLAAGKYADYRDGSGDLYFRCKAPTTTSTATSTSYGYYFELSVTATGLADRSFGVVFG